MSALVNVAIHASQLPDAIRRELWDSLSKRQVNHKFLYDSIKQTQKWLALHQAYSPSRTDPDCQAAYDLSFERTVARIAAKRVHLIGLGCGGGQKDTRLLQLLHAAGKQPSYTPSDVSLAMVLVARQTASSVISEARCHPLVCDLASARDLPAILRDALPLDPGSSPLDPPSRLFTFFGMIPNFEPQIILPRLAELVSPGDHLLLSANLAPGADYGEGVRRILPLYDNALTRDWLMAFLLDLGVEAEDGELRFVTEDDPAGSGLKRVTAYFHFSRGRAIQLDARQFDFRPGEAIRLFFSYRHTPGFVQRLLYEHGLQVLEQWITNSGEEGVFLVSRQ